MSDERSARIHEIFCEALDLPEAERRGFVDSACAGDEGLGAEILRLLEADASRAPGFLEAPLLSLEDTPDPMIGRELDGKYTIVRAIGQGGMGVVYLARQARPRRDVAVKVLRPTLVAGELRRRFEHELELLGRLRHPGIAQVFDAGVVASPLGAPMPYFVMEYVEGVTLDRFARQGGLGTRARVELLARIADAVQHAHQRGVIHRDLKPANIIVDAGGHAKILDFGIARATNSDTLTRTSERHQLVGTLPYMSPEQVEGDPSAIDTRADVYALGVILYELLSGRQPIDVGGCAIAEAARRIRDEAPVALHRTRRDLRGDVETICAKAMEKDRSRRYASASEMAGDIRRYLRGEAILARPASAAYQFSRFARRNRALVAIGAGALLVLVGGLIGVSLALVEASRQRDQALLAQADTRASNDFFKQLLYAVYPEGSARPVNVVDLLDIAVSQLQSGLLRDRPRVEAAVLQPISVAYREMGQLDKAAAASERSIALYESISPKTQSDLSGLTQSLNDLGSVHLTASRIGPAEAALMRALALIEEHDSLASLPAAMVFDHLSQVRGLQGRLEESLELAERSLEIRLGFGSDGPDLGRAHNTMGVILRRLGRFEPALEHYQEALRRFEEEFGHEHPLVATTLNNIALMHMYRGRFEEAEPILLDALGVRERTLGAEHSSIGQTLNALGGVAGSRERHDLAAEYYRRAIDQRLLALSPDDPAVAMCRSNLAHALRKLGRLDEAEREAREALRVNELAFGASHMETNDSLQGLGLILLDAGKMDEADALLRRAWKSAQDTLGEDDPIAAYAGALVASCLLREERYAEAEALLLAAWRAFEREITGGRTIPGQTTYLTRIRDMMREVCQKTGRAAEAEKWTHATIDGKGGSPT